MLALSALAALTWCDDARAQIRAPGAHPKYTVELEPHLVVQYGVDWYVKDAGFGPGIRASIPLLQNGPISTINNSLALGVGVDWALYGDCAGRAGDDCSVSTLLFPVVGQWNFFLTPTISVFGEAGFSLIHGRAEWEGGCFGPSCNEKDLLFRALFFGGGRFLFSDSLGLVVRLGTPYLSVGATLLL